MSCRITDIQQVTDEKICVYVQYWYNFFLRVFFFLRGGHSFSVHRGYIMGVCGYMCHSTHVEIRGQLMVAGSLCTLYTWVLGMELGSSWWAVHTQNHRAMTSACFGVFLTHWCWLHRCGRPLVWKWNLCTFLWWHKDSLFQCFVPVVVECSGASPQRLQCAPALSEAFFFFCFFSLLLVFDEMGLMSPD